MSFPTNAQVINVLPIKKINITQFETTNSAYAEKNFLVDITIENNRIYPVQLSIRVDLLDSMLEFMKKEIGIQSLFTIEGKEKKSFSIPCLIRAGDIDWYKEEYNIKATVFREFPLIDRIIQTDISTVRGIHVKSAYTEKSKVKIIDVFVDNELEEDETKFKVNILIKNDGNYPYNITTSVDLVDKSSVMPELEDYIDLKGLSSERKVIGKSKRLIPINPDCEKNLTIQCSLSRSEIEKKRFNIQAVLTVDIEGNEYAVDMSSLYGIYHNQPLCRDQTCWFIYGGIIATLLVSITVFIWFLQRRKYRF